MHVSKIISLGGEPRSGVSVYHKPFQFLLGASTPLLALPVFPTLANLDAVDVTCLVSASSPVSYPISSRASGVSCCRAQQNSSSVAFDGGSFIYSDLGALSRWAVRSANEVDFSLLAGAGSPKRAGGPSSGFVAALVFA